MVDEGNIYTIDTSDHVLRCKWSTVAAGYIEDEFIKYFGVGTKRSPLLNMLHFLRMKSIRVVIDSFIQHFPDEAVQFVNFGCGLDTVAFWILKNYHNVTCFELDFPEQLEKKAVYMKRAKPIMELMPDWQDSDSCDDGSPLIVTERYKMAGEAVQENIQLQVPADFNNMDAVKSLITKYHLSREQPILFLSECALVYLDVNKGNEIIQFASTVSNRPSCFVYWEQGKTDDKFGKLMLQRFRELGNELVASATYPTVESQIRRYKDLGWKEVAIMDMNTFYNSLVPDSEKKRIKKLECLDEVEEIVIVCSHYVIGVCTTEPEKLEKLFKIVTDTPSKREVKTYTTEEVREMIKNGTLSQMQPAPLNTEWL